MTQSSPGAATLASAVPLTLIAVEYRRPSADVCDEQVVEVAAAEDQQPAEAFAADVGDPTLGMRSLLRSP